MGFIDIHNHILSHLDDGIKNDADMIEILKNAKENQIDKIIATPHYKKGKFENTKEIILNKLAEVIKCVKEENIGIEIYPGSEIFLSKETSNELSQGILQTMNHSAYVLVETTPYSEYRTINLKEELYNLRVDGYKIILAHPERYDFIHRDPNIIYELVKDGCYMQVNVNSLYPHHSNHKLVKKLLDHHLVHFIASDAHDLKNRPLSLHKGYDYILKHYGQTLANQLFYENAQKVIDNDSILTDDCQKLSSKKFFFF